MPTRAEVTTYAKAQNAVVAAAKAKLEKLWRRIDVWDVTAARGALQVMLPGLIRDYGDAAATLAAEWFEQQIGATAVLAEPVGADRVMASARWSLGSILEGNPSQALATLGGVVDRMVKQPGRETIAKSAVKARVLWVRVPTGPSTCAFCLMLASRGGEGTSKYLSAESASIRADGDAYHADCDCVATPVTGPQDFPAGYDPESMYNEYSNAIVRRDGAVDTKATLARMREQLGIS